VEGYTFKSFKNLRAWVRNDLCEDLSGGKLEELLRGLFGSRPASAVIKKGSYKTLFKEDVEGRSCVVKQYCSPGLLRQLKTVFAASRAMREFKAAASMQGRGIPTAPVLLVAEMRRYGMVREGAVAFSFIEGAQELRDFLFYEKGVPLTERRAVIAQCGRISAAIFKNKVFQYDLALNNFLIRHGAGGYELYFIDCERVDIAREPSRSEKYDILARLNRVGAEVSLGDRFAFIKGFIEEDPQVAEGPHAFAAELQKQTVAVITDGLNRGRLTSIYTHARYDRIDMKGCTGLCRKGYSAAGIVAVFEKAPSGDCFFDVTLPQSGDGGILKAFAFPGSGAQRMWASITALMLAGAPLELPCALVSDGRRGLLLLRPAACDRFKSFFDIRSRRRAFLEEHLPGAFRRTAAFIDKAC